MAKKNINNNTGASVVMAKKGCGTIILSQPMIHGPIYLTVFNVTNEIVGDVAEKVKEFKAAGFEITKMTQHEAVAASPKKPTSEKATTNDKPITKTRGEALTEKYGSLDKRREYIQRKNQIWNEEAAKISEEVKKTGKRLRKDAWKKLMDERVTSRLKAEGYC